MKQKTTKGSSKGSTTKARRPAPIVTNENFEALVLASAAQALEIAQGKRKPSRMYQLSARETEVAEPTPYHREDIVRVRAKLGVSQAVLGGLLGRSPAAVRSWELPGSGKKPDGAASRLLEIFEQHPTIAKAYVRLRARATAKLAK